MCEREGWEVAEVLVDNDAGASRWSAVARPQYERLREILTPGTVLVTWESSRAQRDLAAYVELRDLCAERGVLWAYSGRIYDLSRGDDRFGTGLDALIAEREAEQTRERVLRGKRSAALEGRPASALPFGYRRTLEGWEPHPVHAPIVQELARRIIAGESLHGIARDFNRRSLPSPGRRADEPTKPWDNSRIRALFRSPSLAGLRQHRGEIVGAAGWQPIITETQWHQIRAIFDDPARKTTTGRKAVHLLSGIAVCGECGSPLSHRNPRRQRPSYRCPNYCLARRTDLVDELVTEVIVGRLSMPDAAEVFARDDDEHPRAVAELEALRARLEAFTDSAAAGELSPAALARIEARLQPQIDEAQKRVASTVAPAVVRMVSADDVRAAWDALDVADRRQVIRTLCTVTIHKSSVGTRQFNPEDVMIEWKS